jgi:hypothetical protein
MIPRERRVEAAYAPMCRDVCRTNGRSCAGKFSDALRVAEKDAVSGR